MSNVWFWHCFHISYSSSSSFFSILLSVIRTSAVIIGDNSNFMHCTECTSSSPSPSPSPRTHFAIYFFYLDNAIPNLLPFHRFAPEHAVQNLLPSPLLPSSMEPTVDVVRSLVYSVLHIQATCSNVFSFVFFFFIFYHPASVHLVLSNNFHFLFFSFFFVNRARATSASTLVIDRWENINMNANDDVMSRWLYRVANNNTTEGKKKESPATTTQHSNTGKQPQDTRARRTAIMCDTLQKNYMDKSIHRVYAVKP